MTCPNITCCMLLGKQATFIVEGASKLNIKILILKLQYANIRNRFYPLVLTKFRYRQSSCNYPPLPTIFTLEWLFVQMGRVLLLTADVLLVITAFIFSANETVVSHWTKTEKAFLSNWYRRRESLKAIITFLLGKWVLN